MQRQKGIKMFSKVKDLGYEFLWNIRNRRYPAPRSEDIGDKIVKIFVITHKDDDLPPVFANRDVYVPLRVGNAVNPTARKDWLVDDEGENISAYNPLINEMTGIWWVAKHYEKLGNPDYVGFMHYRRFLQWTPSLLKQGHVISTSGTSIHQLATLDASLHLDLFRAEFAKRLPPNVLKDYDDYWRSHTLYYANMFITDKSSFFRYFEIVSQCIEFVLEMIDRKAVDLSNANSYDRRLYGFYLERITSFCICRAKRAGRIVNINTRVDFLG